LVHTREPEKPKGIDYSAEEYGERKL